MMEKNWRFQRFLLFSVIATLTVLTVYGGGGFVTTSQPECSNKVGCHQCKLDSGCPSLQSFMTVDEHDCYGTCEFTESCLGIQYDFHTKTCMLFGYNPSCQKVEHVYNGTYVYFRKSCRTECDILDDPTNGIVTLTDIQYFNTAFYECEPGFQMIGDNQRKCENGIWQGSAPSCEAVQTVSATSQGSKTIATTTVQSTGIPLTTQGLMTTDISSSPVMDSTSVQVTTTTAMASSIMPSSASTAYDTMDSTFLPSSTIQTPFSATHSLVHITSLQTSVTQLLPTPTESAGSTFSTNNVLSPTSVPTTAIPTSFTSGIELTILSTTVESPVPPTNLESYIASSLPTPTVGSPGASINTQSTTGATVSFESAVITISVPSIASPTLEITSTPSQAIISSIVVLTTSVAPTNSPTAFQSVLNVSSSPSASISPKPIYIWPCLCSNRLFAGLTQDEIIEQLVNDVKIKPQSTKLAVSKRICMEDSRTSSTSMGVLGVTLIATCAAFIVFLDLIGRIPLACPCCKQVKRRFKA